MVIKVGKTNDEEILYRKVKFRGIWPLVFNKGRDIINRDSKRRLSLLYLKLHIVLARYVSFDSIPTKIFKYADNQDSDKNIRTYTYNGINQWADRNAQGQVEY